MSDISDKTVTIVGGTGDQGYGLALRWARAGFRVIIGSRESISRGWWVADCQPTVNQRC